MADSLSRRTVLKGVAASAVAGGVAPVSPASASAARGGPVTPKDDWAAFDRAVQSAVDRMHVVGAAVAVVSADRVVHTVT